MTVTSEGLPRGREDRCSLQVTATSKPALVAPLSTLQIQRLRQLQIQIHIQIQIQVKIQRRSHLIWRFFWQVQGLHHCPHCTIALSHNKAQLFFRTLATVLRGSRYKIYHKFKKAQFWCTLVAFNWSVLLYVVGHVVRGPVIHIYEEQWLKNHCQGLRTLSHPVPDKQQQAHSLETGVISWW